MLGCATRIVLRGQKPLALCDRCPCFGSLYPPLAALTFAASSIICAFGLAAAAPRSPYRHLELCGIAFTMKKTIWKAFFAQCSVTLTTCITITGWKFRFGSKPFEVGQRSGWSKSLTMSMQTVKKLL